MSTPYSVSATEAAVSASAMTRLWGNSFELLQGEHAQRKLEHFYLSNPAGSGPVFLLRENLNGTDVGVQTLVLRRFTKGDQAFMAGTLADYAVDPAHRSLGPALQLLKASISGSKDTLAFLYGLPNRKAEPILKRAGLEPILHMTRYAAPLRSRSYLAGRVPRVFLGVTACAADVLLAMSDHWRMLRLARSIRWASAGDAAIDAIWEKAQRCGLLLSERSSKVLAWRFKTAENSRWQVDVAFSGREQEPLGYVVWALRDGIAVVRDFLSADPLHDSGHLLAAFRCKARAQGAVAISMEYCGSHAVVAALENAGLVPRESNPVYAVKHQSTLPPTDSWYLTTYDRDTD